MRRIIRRKLSGQVLGALLFIVGLGVLLAVLMKAWIGVSASPNLLSALWAYILTEQVSIASLVVLKLVYVTIMGSVFLVMGIVVLGFSRQIFYVSGESVWLQCPYCKNSWRARRAVGWAECPHCRKFLQPQVKKTGT
jgi:hypothetical protein